MKSKYIYIEKYDFSTFEKEQKPYAMILTDVIQRTPPNRMREAFLWVFLESLPPTWIPNKKHIMNHFDISERTYERWMSWLNSVNLIEYRQDRNKSGSFGQGALFVLSGSKFNPDAESTGAVKIGKSLINKKKIEVIHNNHIHRVSKIGGSVYLSKTHATIDESGDSPNRQKTEARLNGAHINTTIKKINTIKKTNSVVSVFSNTCSLRDFVRNISSTREMSLSENVIDQVIYYVGNENDNAVTTKKINIALKKIREGVWNTPNGFNSINCYQKKQNEDNLIEEKKKMYAQEALSMEKIENEMKLRSSGVNMDWNSLCKSLGVSRANEKRMPA